MLQANQVASPKTRMNRNFICGDTNTIAWDTIAKLENQGVWGCALLSKTT